VRYVFMAEELLKGPSRDGDAIERADRMISRLRPDPTRPTNKGLLSASQWRSSIVSDRLSPPTIVPPIKRH
jgi:hypothetical protein